MASYSRTYYSTSSRYRSRVKGGLVQKPINRMVDNPYNWNDFRIISQFGVDQSYTESLAYTTLSDQWTNRFGALYARCYDKVYREASGGKRGAMAITLIEWRSSFGMIAGAARSIQASAHALRRGNILLAMRELNIRDRRGSARKMRERYDNGARLDRLWLELNFGWGPLIDDIRTACAVLAQEVPVEKVKARSTEPYLFSERKSGPGWSYSKQVEGRKQLMLSTRVVGVNPNILLAKQLGLTNPAHVAWDAVPMSFVVDWFLPVGQYLKSFDASIGVSLAPVTMSKKARFWSQVTNNYQTTIPPTVNSVIAESSEFRRTIAGSIPLPSLKSRMVMPSWDNWRAVTSVALASQQLLAIHANQRVS